MTKKDERLTIPQAAAITGLSQQQIKNLIDHGKLRVPPAYRNQGYSVVLHSALDQWVEKEFGSYKGLAEAIADQRAEEAKERQKVIKAARAEADRLELVLAELTLERSRKVMAEMRRKQFWRDVEDARRAGFRHAQELLEKGKRPTASKPSKATGREAPRRARRLTPDDPIVVRLKAQMKARGGSPVLYGGGERRFGGKAHIVDESS